MAIDVSRLSDGLAAALPAEVSAEILADMQRESIIQQLCRRVKVPGTGLVIPIITADPEAEWVSETEEKPVRHSEFGTKALKPYTLAVIEPFSKQFARDLPGLYNECRTRLPRALAKKFDRTCLGYDAVPGSGFDTLADAPEIALGDDAYGALLGALGSVVDSADGADISSWALSPQGELAVLAARDEQGRPLFTPNASEGGAVGSLLARPVHKTSHVAGPAAGGGGTVAGIAGDWETAVWGYVNEIRVDLSDQAPLNIGGTQVNLWQRNMIAVRAECEIGFAVRDEDRFVKLVGSGG